MPLELAGGSDQGGVALGVFMVGRRLKLLPVHGQGDAVAVGLNRDLVPWHRDPLGADTKEAADIDDRLCDGATLAHQQVADLTDLLALSVQILCAAGVGDDRAIPRLADRQRKFYAPF